MSRPLGNNRVLALVVLLVVVFGSTLQNRANLYSTQPEQGLYNTTTASHRTELTNQTQIQSLPKESPFLLAKSSPQFRPTTKLDRECIPGPSQPLQKVESFPYYQNSSNFWKPVSEAEKLVVCELPLGPSTTSHLPHVMQRLYACFSYWQDYPTRQPILLISEPFEVAHAKLNQTRFLGGFLHAMRIHRGVRWMSRDELDAWVNDTMKESGGQGTKSYTVQTFDISGGYILSHVRDLIDVVRADLHNVPAAGYNQQSNTTMCLSQEFKPRIGILNRRSNFGRSITNVNELIEGISDIPNISLSVAPVEYFEGQDFQHQVEFFHDIDILISPHGAQLTGLPFMASKPCSQLLELFPQRYSIPNFFGSLAVNAQVGYSYLYLSGNNPEAEQAQDLGDRIAARAVNLCPMPSVIKSSIESLVQDWRECCATQKQSDP